MEKDFFLCLFDGAKQRRSKNTRRNLAKHFLTTVSHVLLGGVTWLVERNILPVSCLVPGTRALSRESIGD